MKINYNFLEVSRAKRNFHWKQIEDSYPGTKRSLSEIVFGDSITRDNNRESYISAQIDKLVENAMRSSRKKEMTISHQNAS